jgi:hypothetical protein
VYGQVNGASFLNVASTRRYPSGSVTVDTLTPDVRGTDDFGRHRTAAGRRGVCAALHGHAFYRIQTMAVAKNGYDLGRIEVLSGRRLLCELAWISPSSLTGVA